VYLKQTLTQRIVFLGTCITRPKRTRKSSGSVIRIFRGESVGQLGGTVSANGLDRSVLVKEFRGDLALPRSKLESLIRLQSDLMSAKDEDAKLGEWIRTASLEV
jgi:hypothetical protein